jgi:hypothetical protein
VTAQAHIMAKLQSIQCSSDFLFCRYKSVEGIVKFLSVKVIVKKLIITLLCTFLWASLYAQEAGEEAPDPADYLPREYAAVDVTRITVPIRSFKTRVSATVEMFYLPISNEATLTYQCLTNVFDVGDAQIACEKYAQDFLLKNQRDAFFDRIQRGLQKPYYHFRIAKKPDLRYIKDVDPRKHETKYFVYVQFY